MSSSVQNPLWTTNYQPTSTGISATQSPASAQNSVNNEASGLNSILGLASQGAQIAGAINYQRQQSGASARRQTLISQCGRKPLFGRDRKDEYRKCKADYETSLLTPVGGGGQGGDENKNLGDEQRSSSMKFVYIGLGVLALGGIAYLALKKK